MDNLWVVTSTSGKRPWDLKGHWSRVQKIWRSQILRKVERSPLSPSFSYSKIENLNFFDQGYVLVYLFLNNIRYGPYYMVKQPELINWLIRPRVMSLEMRILGQYLIKWLGILSTFFGEFKFHLRFVSYQTLKKRGAGSKMTFDPKCPVW